MANLINLTVVQSTASKNGGFVTKLQAKQPPVSTITPFGTKTTSKQITYYIKLDQAPPVGLSAPLDLDSFKVTERAHDIPDDQKPGHMKTISLKWLTL